ncbi:MAG: RedB protein [Candidatus Hydrogenedentes bacterium]|nr:RedB protein [Candidatus Hydrogenedentota bacterium]
MGNKLLYCLTGSWLALVCAGMVVVERHSVRAGQSASSGNGWPVDTHLSRSADKPALLIFAHPHCPCTEAMMSEMFRIEARHPGAFDPTVVFTVPEGGDTSEWTETSLIQRARQLQSVKVVFDPGGREAALFSAKTSGQIMLYDVSGHPLFTGGITAARGHEGNNDGRKLLEAALTHPDGSLRIFPVFGCGLVVPDAARPQKEAGPRPGEHSIWK